jgi:hypothetical protein
VSAGHGGRRQRPRGHRPALHPPVAARADPIWGPGACRASASDGKIRAVELSAVERERRQAPHDQEERQEHRQLEHRSGGVHQRFEVQRRAARDEEERDQQPEPDRVELGLESLHLPAPQDQPDDQARGERAEDHVQPEIGSDHHKREQQQHGEAHRELAAGVQVPLDERPVTTHRAGSQPGRDDGHEDERRQQQRLTDGVGRRTQEQRHDQHRAELANRAGAQDEGAQPRLELAGIPQHRHQRPERRSGHRGADEQAGEDHPGCRKRYGKP